MDLQILQDFYINTNQHWGPQISNHQQYNDLPLSFLKRYEKIGKCCDLSQVANKKIQDQNQFIMIEGNTKKISKQTVVPRPKVYQQLKNQQANRNIHSNFNNKQNKSKQNYLRYKQATKAKFKESITVKNNWIQVRDIVKSNFDQQVIKQKDVVLQNIKQIGLLKALDPQIQKIQRKQYKLNYLKNFQLQQKITLNDDFLVELISNQTENPTPKRKVYCLQNYLTALMTLKVSQFPWHIKVNKSGNIMILDNFQNGQLSFLDLFCVNQNTQNNMPEESKIYENCIKATKVTESFKQQIATGKQLYSGDDNDESQQQKSQKRLVKYVKLNIQKNLEIYTRVQVDGAKQKINEDEEVEVQSVLVRSLFETQTNYQWKKKFETTAGQVISQQYLANNCNWQKWMIQAYLGGVNKIKAGYISEGKNDQFFILNVAEITPKQIQKNITFKIHQCWPVVKYILNAIFEQQDGEYVLLKSPYQSTIKLYNIPSQEEQDETNNS